MRTCSIEGCKEKHLARNYCEKHYRRWYRHGNPLTLQIKEICSIPGCNKKHAAKGYCEKHYQKFRIYGDPLIGRNNEMHNKWGIPEYWAWSDIKGRCLNINHPSYKYYGARGITVCKEWLNSFIAFYKDMGPRPFPKACIDRIDNNKGYLSGNCQWTTMAKNCQNRTSTKLSLKIVKEIRKLNITEKYTQKKLAEIYNVTVNTISNVIRNKTWI